MFLTSSQLRPVQARVRGGANGTGANKQSAKRTRDLFGEQCGGMEYPSKRAALEIEKVKVTDKSAQDWVCPTLHQACQ